LNGVYSVRWPQAGDYLLPVNVVMPGEWEVKLVFMKGKEPVFRGRITFKV